MGDFTVVAFYTINTPYEDEVRGLVKSCKELGIRTYIKGYESRGSWVENCALKPSFLLHVLQNVKDCDRFVYLDADARVRQYPSMFDTLHCDLAFHRRFGRELLSGTIYFEKNRKVLDLFTGWQQAQLRSAGQWDQRVLASVLQTWRHPLDVVNLPLTYTQIFDAKERTEAPIIEHMQASRQFKKIIEMPEIVTEVPHVLRGQRLRRGQDGCIFIVRQNPELVREMNKRYTRIDYNKWRPRVLSDSRIENFRHVFTNRETYIIGKGPSLDHLRAEHFPNAHAPVIALNEAIHIVEKLDLPNPTFGLQQDAALRARCRPSRSPIFVSTKAANFYASYEDAYIFENVRLELPKDALSVSAALRLSQFLGTKRYVLMCFDSCTHRVTEYAKAIGYKSTWGGDPARFLGHKARILRRAGDLPVAWVTPRPLLPETSSSDDSTQP